MSKFGRVIFFLGAAFLTALHAEAGKEAVLVRDGSARSVILYSSQPEQSLGAKTQVSKMDDTAREFADYIHRISGASVEVRGVAPENLKQTIDKAKSEDRVVVLLGALAASQLKGSAEANAALSDPSGFVINVSPNVVAVAGGSARGTEIGVHILLEQIGVRWFFPGTLGTVVPEAKTISLPVQQTAERASFAARQFQLQGADDWLRHQPTGGLYFGGGHGIKLGEGITPANHPEVFALVNGKRTGPQLCVSNPETLRLAVEQAREWFKKNPNMPWYGMGPEDKSGFCQCPECRALDGGDWDPFSAEPSMTDRYVWFYNQVLAALKPEFPDKKIAFYIYHSYMRPPVKVKPDANLVGAIAPIALCRIHGMDNPVCPEQEYLKRLVEDWKKLLPELYERGYWFNLADPGMWFVQTSRLKEEIGNYAKEGIAGFRVECLGNWAVEGPSLYIAGQLMWNAQADTKALLADYCQKLFGPAAQPMEEYFTLLDGRLRDSDLHDGSAFDMLAFYPFEVRKKAGALIAKAEELAKDSPYKERVGIFARGFRYADAFAEMREAQNRQDWAEAHRQLETMDALRGQLVGDYDFPMLNAGSTKNYLARFFRLPVEQGYARTQNGNELVAALQDQWDFLTDPQKTGESLGYERAGLRGGNWQPMATWTKTWGQSGLRYYKGLAWYRQEVEIPEKWMGKRIFLWFGGVDESARVWVNGKCVGTSPFSAFTPFEVDVSHAIHPGQNSVALCVANLQVDELGTGGLVAPAFFYAPVLGEKATLENIKPLRSTFP